MPYSSVSYTGNGSTTVYTVPFGFIESDDVQVTVDNVVKTFTWTGDNQVTLSAAPANGSVVKIYRTTDVDGVVSSFNDGASFVAGDLNENFNQLLYLLQEIVDDKTNLRDYVDGVVISGGGLPSVPGDGYYLGTSGGSWVAVSLSDLKDQLVGIGLGGGSSDLPDASATFTVLTSNSSTYALQDAATLRTSLGIGSAYPLNVPSGGPFTTLGTAAFVDTGTGSGNVPLISNLGNVAFKTGTDTGGIHSGRVPVLTDNDGTIGLPAMDGSRLTGIKKMGDFYSVHEKQSSSTHGGTYSGGWQTRKLNTEMADEVGVDNPASDGTITLPAGHYAFCATAKCVGLGHAAIKLVTVAGTSLGQSMFIKGGPLGDPGDPSSDAPAEIFLEFSGKFILGATTGVRLQIRGTTGMDLSSTQYALGIAHGSSALGLNTYSTLELWKMR
jgi:hypothetical protein